MGSDYYEELLLPLAHHIEIPGEPGGVKTPHVWTIVSETANACTIANCVYTFHTTFTPKMRKMWGEDV